MLVQIDNHRCGKTHKQNIELAKRLNAGDCVLIPIIDSHKIEIIKKSLLQLGCHTKSEEFFRTTNHEFAYNSYGEIIGFRPGYRVLGGYMLKAVNMKLIVG